MRAPISIYAYPLPLDGILATHKRAEVARRVARIHGHVHAVNEMLDEGRSYTEIVHQIVAVRSALDSVIQVIVDDLVEDCVTRAEKKEPLADSLEELQQVVAKIR
jgi:DNA-binding FrmR family transcriptional regulator